MTVITPDPLRWKAKRDPKVLDRVWERVWKGVGPIARLKRVMRQAANESPRAGLRRTLKATEEMELAAKKRALREKYTKGNYP